MSEHADGRLVALPVDPGHVWACWQIPTPEVERLRRESGGGALRVELRLIEASSGRRAAGFSCGIERGSARLKAPRPGGTYRVEFGVLLRGAFSSLLSCGPVALPRGGGPAPPYPPASGQRPGPPTRQD